MILISHFDSTFSLETFGYFFYGIFYGKEKFTFESVPSTCFWYSKDKIKILLLWKEFFFFNFGSSKSVRLLILPPLPLLLKYGFLISVIPRIYSLSLFKISNMQNLIQKVNQATLMWPDVSFKSQFKFWMQKLELGFSFPCVYKYSIGTTLILRKNYAHILLKMFYSKRG